ncbi:MAG: alpha/beta hydrolase, partial [Clostridia bacterium]|nr:alpha/beta hydrolase [Clostridia bacterium]
YGIRAAHEGEGYARFLNSKGIDAFVVDYRCTPTHFPYELLDARRSVRFVRANAEKFGIDPNKIAVMGSSAGGHLAALVSTYRGTIGGEGADALDEVDYRPNATILCYPVINGSEDGIRHLGSFLNLLGKDATAEELEEFSLENQVDDETPPAFIWHTSEDQSVNVINSYKYATALRKHKIPCELHVFPFGPHGLGLADESYFDFKKSRNESNFWKGDYEYISKWASLLADWLKLFGYRN